MNDVDGIGIDVDVDDPPCEIVIVVGGGGDVLFGTSGGGGGGGTELIISFHTGNKAGLSSYDLPGTSWNPFPVPRYRREYTTRVPEAVYERT